MKRQLFASLLLSVIPLSTSVAAHATPEVNVDANPYVRGKDVVDKENSGKRFYIKKTLMPWKDGWIYAKRKEQNDGSTVYQLGHVNCIKKQFRTLYWNALEKDGSFSGLSNDYDYPFETVKDSEDVVSMYCNNEPFHFFDAATFKTLDSNGDKTNFTILDRDSQTVVALLFDNNIHQLNSYDKMRYHCKTRESKVLFSMQTTSLGEVVQYEAYTLPKWDEKGITDPTELKLYNAMVDKICQSK
jgi:hypothetical protein